VVPNGASGAVVVSYRQAVGDLADVTISESIWELAFGTACTDSFEAAIHSALLG